MKPKYYLGLINNSTQDAIQDHLSSNEKIKGLKIKINNSNYFTLVFILF